jgi:hypothetical protein
MIAAKLYRDVRGAERSDVHLDATMRDAGWTPTDVVIINISTSGVLLEVSADIPIGESITIGIAGIGLVPSRVVRRHGRTLGCEFRTPVAAARIAEATQAQTVVALPFLSGPLRIDAEARWSRRTRLAILLMAGISAWGTVAAILVLVHAIF